jgi:hypothetical protein
LYSKLILETRIPLCYYFLHLEEIIMKKLHCTEKYFMMAVFIAVMSAGSFNSKLTAGDEYGYIGDQVAKEIYEAYNDMDVLGDEYLPVSEWNNPELEKACLKNLSDTYSDEKNKAAKVKVLKVYLNYPRWKTYTKVSSDAYNGIPTHRKTFCIYVLQKDADKYMIVWAKEVWSDCTNYDRTTLKPLSYSAPRVTTMTVADWEDWGKVTAFKLTKEQVTSLGLLPGKNTKPAVNKNKAALSVSLEYTPGTPARAAIQAKNKTTYLVLWEEGDYSCLTNDEYKKATNGTPAANALKVGTKVTAQWTNGAYYNGKILQIKGKKYTIGWDDGSDPLDVTIDQIRVSQ